MAGSEMTFWDHLDDLRRVLFRVVIVVMVLGIGAFAAMPWLFEHVIMAPCSPAFPTYRLFDPIIDSGAGNEFSIDVVSLELASQLSESRHGIDLGSLYTVTDVQLGLPVELLTSGTGTL